MAAVRLPKPFTLEELERLDQAAANGEGPALRFLIETGMRSAEALSITRTQAEDWPHPGRIFGRHPDPAVRIIGKGDKERTVVLSRAALLAAQELLEIGQPASTHPIPTRWDVQGRTPTPSLVPDDRTSLFPWSERGLRWKLEQLGKRAGVHCHPHRARHTWITQLVEAGNPIEVVADMAGHSSVDTTRLYFLLSERSKREAMARRRRWLRG